jgi:D-serine deaminase-like pyridoxal phosphate-dependent protein
MRTWPDPDAAPGTVDEIPTPALVVDVAALQRNIERMAAFFATGSCRLRPHVKAHKTPEIARRQLAAGSCVGLTCATVGEAEAVADLCDDLLLANEVVGAAACARLAALAGRARVTVAVDSADGLEAVAAAARARGVTLGVLVDLDVGQGRCGVAPGEAALALARRAASLAGVRLRGVMGYEGHLQPVRERAERAGRARAAMEALVGTAAMVREAGLPCEVVSGGGTGTFDTSGRVPGVTEIPAGSYALMDSDYGEVGVPFEQASWILGTIVSRPTAGRCVADCGQKSLTRDHGLPGVRGRPDWRLTRLNDEHAIIELPEDADVAVGDRVAIVPSHTDPTVNLHDVMYAIDGTRVVGLWPVAARGYSGRRPAAAGRSA